MTAGQFWLLVLILGAILFFVGLPWLAGRRDQERRWNPASTYLTAIDALIRGRRYQAMEALRRVAREESDNLLAYLRLGDLVRVMGHPEKAERIHAGLLARPEEDPDLGLKVKESLLEDHLAQKHWDQVVQLGESLRAVDRRNVAALRALTLAYDERREWERAFECLDEWNRLDPNRTIPRPAQMRLHVAALHLEAERTREARHLCEEAIRIDGGVEGAHILLGDVFAREGEHEKAAEQWLEYARRSPDAADAVFDRLERSYYELGRFGDLLPIYERLREAAPGSVPATLALADMHRRRGRTDEAIALLESLLAANPRHREARRLLVSCLLQVRRTEAAVREIEALLRELPGGAGTSTCVRCGRSLPDLGPKCPDCGAWQPPSSSRAAAPAGA